MLADLITSAPHTEEVAFAAIEASRAPVVLFGAGELAWYSLEYLRQHGIEPVCICDNDPKKQGTSYLGLPVYSYDGMREEWGAGAAYNVVVSVGPQYRDAIYAQLAAAGDANPAWYLRGYEVCGEKITYAFFREHLAQFEEAYSLLADDASRKVFVNVLNAKLSGDFSLYQEVMGGVEYFDPDVVHLSDHEVLLDVGAYKGDVIVEFVRQTGGKYDQIIAFEPDKGTLAILEGTVAAHGIGGVEVRNMGAWHERAVLHFHDGRAGSSRVSEAVESATPSTSIDVDTIDSILRGRRVTYISMDIEGAERSALLGGALTIATWKPRVAVCVYHKREDLYDIILLLASQVPGYRFFLRHYSDNQTETVLYAV